MQPVTQYEQRTGEPSDGLHYSLCQICTTILLSRVAVSSDCRTRVELNLRIESHGQHLRLSSKKAEGKSMVNPVWYNIKSTFCSVMNVDKISPVFQ